MRGKHAMSAMFGGAILLAAGCHTNTVDQAAFKSAINDYYSGKQECVWSTPIKFPAQADTSKDEQTQGFDALVDAGLLTRKTAEKSRFLIGSKQVNDYDLSELGRKSWTPDPAQPGYGNFCYAHPEVIAIDSYNPTDDAATRYSVTYHYHAANPPDWANNPEMKTAFPKLGAETSGQQVATATLVKSESGWLVQSVQAAPMPSSSM